MLGSSLKSHTCSRAFLMYLFLQKFYLRNSCKDRSLSFLGWFFLFGQSLYKKFTRLSNFRYLYSLETKSEMVHQSILFVLSLRNVCDCIMAIYKIQHADCYGNHSNIVVPRIFFEILSQGSIWRHLVTLLDEMRQNKQPCWGLQSGTKKVRKLQN